MRIELNKSIEVRVVANTNSGQVERVFLNGVMVKEGMYLLDDLADIIFDGRRNFWNAVAEKETEINLNYTEPLEGVPV